MNKDDTMYLQVFSGYHLTSFPSDSHYYRQYGNVLVIYRRSTDPACKRGVEVGRFNGEWGVSRI